MSGHANGFHVSEAVLLDGDEQAIDPGDATASTGEGDDCGQEWHLALKGIRMRPVQARAMLILLLLKEPGGFSRLDTAMKGIVPAQGYLFCPAGT